MTPGAPQAQPRRSAATSRAVGMAMLGSAIALATIAALAYGRLLPVADDVRGWMAAGLGVAAALDAVIGAYFLKSASQS